MKKETVMIRMIATDLDGTLLENGVIPPRMNDLMRKMVEKGIRFVVCSGRQYWNVRCLFSDFDFIPPAVCENGAALWAEDKLLYCREYPLELSREIFEAMLAKGMNLMVNTPYVSYLYSPNHAYTDDVVYRLRNTSAHLHSLKEVMGPIIKVSGQTEQSRTEEIARELAPQFEGRTTMALAGMGWLDFSLADKASGLRKMAEHFGVSLEEIAAFGDNFNDVPMLDLAGHPYIMKTAAQALREKGYALCDNAADTIAALVAAN